MSKIMFYILAAFAILMHVIIIINIVVDKVQPTNFECLTIIILYMYVYHNMDDINE